jgi:general secretion pathway protein C
VRGAGLTNRQSAAFWNVGRVTGIDSTERQGRRVFDPDGVNGWIAMRVFDGLLRRHFWVVQLLLLLGIAFLAAQVISNLLAVRIVSLQTRPVQRAGRAVATVGQADVSAWATLIAARNLFNAHPPEPVILEPGGVVAPERGVGAPPGPGEPCEPSTSAISLMATMVAQPVQWSSAVVDDGVVGHGRVVRRGSALGAHVLVAIHRTRIVLVSDGAGFECVSVGPKRRPRAARAPARAGAGVRRARSGGVKKVGAHDYVIDRAMLDEQLADLNRLAKDAGVVAVYRDGKPQGFKLVRVRAGSVFSQIGLRRGDVLKGVNDEAVTRPNQALALFEQLKNTDQVTVMLERRGRPVTLDYSIK